ncbi:MAG: thiamine phosphate synthase, partial [Acidobacteria bacterium]|nr:thiamine phosphate synthase [Acidobacteriota bacterium]
NPDPVVGLDGLRRLRPLSTRPLVAIGGITIENAAEVLRAGADSVAVISGLVANSRAGVRSLAERFLRETRV